MVTQREKPSGNEAVLLIRCPGCGQRFRVGEDLRGKTVECGSCDLRFRITDALVVRGRKFYPGEHRDPILDHLGRVPLVDAMKPLPVATIEYAPMTEVGFGEPVPPLRLIAGAVGGALLVLMGLLLIAGAERGGLLEGMSTAKRMVMAGFGAVTGTGLLAFAAGRFRAKGPFIGMAMGAVLMALPLIFTGGSTPLKAERNADASPRIEAPANAEGKAPDPGLEELREKIGTAPLDAEIARLEREGSSRKAHGLWLRGMREMHRLMVREYVIRAASAAPESHFYPRGGDFLMVVTGTDKSLEELAEVARAMGKVKQMYEPISVIEVEVNNSAFEERPVDALTNRGHPDFYAMNLEELKCIDLDRAEAAVKRIAEAPPREYRTDITVALIRLLRADWVPFKGEICRALAVWSERPGEAGDVALAELDRLEKVGGVIPYDAVSLVVKEGNPGVLPILHRLWVVNPTRWETLYMAMGPAAEAYLLPRFQTLDESLRRSAVRVLGRTGTEKCLSVLQAAAASAETELRVLIDQAVSAVRTRIGG